MDETPNGLGGFTSHRVMTARLAGAMLRDRHADGYTEDVMGIAPASRAVKIGRAHV